MRFLCDEMLARLARLLRAAGHDAALVAPGAPDRVLVQQARAQDRWLVTRDRDLARQAGERALLLRSEQLDDEAVELSRRIPIDWLAAPFSRCPVDNALLDPARPQDLRQIPQTARALPGPFNRCPACGRLYWPGSHVKRMLAKLTWLQEQALPAGGSEGTKEFRTMTTSKHSPSGHTPTTLPHDDLEDNPGIGSSKGTTMAGEDAELIEGENTVEGDIENDVMRGGGIDPNQRSRTSH
jgi:uncharacterized protein